VNSRITSTRLRAIFEALTIAAFLALLWLPTLDVFLNLDHAPVPGENRRPAAWPRFEGFIQSRVFIGGIEAYFNDHFGFRKQLVRWNNHWKAQLFVDASGREVLLGREGWLFLSSGRMFEHWSRQITWSERDLADWRRLLEMRRDWLRARGIRYLLVLPPDKQTVYPEYLPEWMGRSAKPSKIQQLTEYMKARSTVEVLDLSQTLIEAKKVRETYLKTDTHWNLFGGFVGCRALVAALGRQCPGLEPLPLDAYDWKPLTQPGGDLARMLGQTEARPETQAFEPVARMPLPTLEAAYDPVRLPQRGVKESWPCFTRNDKAAGKALVFCDSFAKGWHPFLGQHFKEVIYLRQDTWDCPLIEREKPDVVIDEMLERGFNLKDPLALAHKDKLAP
jgi:alginate O-acetyltransferase complex protein AlgJ